MKSPDHLLAANTDRLPISTQAEVQSWLHTEAIGNTAHAAMYLDRLREITEIAESMKGTPEGSLLMDTITLLAGEIGRSSEKNFQKQKVLDDGTALYEIEGVTPFREVNDNDIMLTAVKFNANHPEFKNYENSEGVTVLHQNIESLVRQDLKNDQEQSQG